LNETQIKRHLKALGYRSEADRTELVSPSDNALNEIQMKAGVDYSGPLAGRMAGFYKMQGHPVLVTTSPNIITPTPGACPTIINLIKSLLDDEKNMQRERFLAWLKIFLEGLYTNIPRSGQALILAGPHDCGKSLLQLLLTVILGGRAARPYQFAMGGTNFNADLLQAEHLQIEDEAPSTDMRSRRTFGVFLKGIAANSVHRLHGKNKDAITLEPHWRASVSVNDEPEHLLVLPPLDETLIDKLLVFKCSPPERPFNDGSRDGRKAYWDQLIAELPAFIYHVMEFSIPDELTCHRFGVKAFIVPV
jgi:hypothetical protein